MVAVLPGEPQTSSVMVLALNWSMTSPDEPPPNEPLWTPKTPCSRWTTNPDSATTATNGEDEPEPAQQPLLLGALWAEFFLGAWGNLRISRLSPWLGGRHGRFPNQGRRLLN